MPVSVKTCTNHIILYRLNKLKLKEGNEERVHKEYSAEEESDDEREASKIVEKALAENRLELDSDQCSNAAMDDELPWCQICNDDAQLRCVGCQRDLYCRRCWKETHKDSELKRHAIETYKTPN